MLTLFGLVGASVGLTTAVLLPSAYQSSAAFQAETGQSPQFTGALSGLASQLSALPFGSSNTAQFLGDLLTTDAVLRRVARATFPWQGSLAGMPTIYGFESRPERVRDYLTVERLRRALKVDVNIRTGVVRFTVTAPSPVLAGALAETTLAALNTANIDLRQARAAAERQFIAERADQARKELDSTQADLAAFYQRNRVISSAPLLVMEEAKLKRDVEMAQQLFVQLRLQEEQAAVQQVRNTPVIAVIDPPVVPVRRSWPKRSLAVMVGFGLGLATAFVRLMIAQAGASRAKSNS